MIESMEEIKIYPPTPRTCRACATMHDPRHPHDRDSLYYQNWFRKRHKRVPTWGDAMAHCDEETKAAFVKELARRGIYVEETAEDEKPVDGD